MSELDSLLAQLDVMAAHLVREAELLLVAATRLQDAVAALRREAEGRYEHTT